MDGTPVTRRARPWHGAALALCVSATTAAAQPARVPTASAARVGGAVVRGTVDTVTFWAQSLGVRKRALVYRPPSYESSAGRRYPVAYYLHGLWGNETNWTALGALDATLDSLAAAGAPEMIVVMPDGDDGWYTTWNRLLDVSLCRRDFVPRDGDATADAYCVPWSHYDDYIARDVVGVIDSMYRTLADRRHRGIAGLSMGGYGALSIAFRYPDVFSAGASHSGVLSPRYAGARPFDGTPRYAPSAEALREGWGERFWPLIAPAFGSDTAGWVARDPARLAQRLVTNRIADRPAVFIDCGTEDELIDQSRALKFELERLGFTPRYAEWPGKHDWSYWRVHAAESARWMADAIAAPRRSA